MNMNPPTLHAATFVGGADGAWRVNRVSAVRGDSLEAVERLEIHAGAPPSAAGAWALRGVASHARYSSAPRRSPRPVFTAARSRRGEARGAHSDPEVGRVVGATARRAPGRLRGALASHRRQHGIPARIAGRLYHARDLGEPFGFLTWFEFAPQHAQAFDDLLGMPVTIASAGESAPSPPKSAPP